MSTKLLCVEPFSTQMELSFVCILFWYVTSHPGQLSLLPSAGWEMSSVQWAVAALFVWEGNYGSGVTL